MAHLVFIVLLNFSIISCGESNLHNAQSASQAPQKQEEIRQESIDIKKIEDKTFTEVLKGSEQDSSLPTDVIFAVDTSGSMKEETLKLQETLPKFIEELSKAFPGESFQMFMLADEKGIDVSLSNPDQRYHIKDHEVDSNNALEVMYEFIDDADNQCNNEQTSTEGCVRKNSRKELVVVSDDASDYSTSEFKTLVSNHSFLSQKTSVNGFVGTSVNDDKDWCSIVEPGQTYIDLANDSSTFGLVQHLCEENYAELLANLSDSIISRSLQKEFELEHTVDLDAPITIKVDDSELKSDQYSIVAKKLTLVKGVGSAQVLTVSYTPFNAIE